MLFAADIGNSCIDIGLFDEAGNLKMKSKISSVGSRTVDEYTVVISGLLAANGFVVGAPYTNYKVTANVVKNGKGKKLHIFRYKSKKNEKKHIGHRQPYTKLQITSIAQ